MNSLMKSIALCVGCLSMTAQASANSCEEVRPYETSASHTFDKYKISIKNINESWDKVRVYMRPRGDNCTSTTAYLIYKNGVDVTKKSSYNSTGYKVKIHDDPGCDHTTSGYFDIDLANATTPLTSDDVNDYIQIMIGGTEKSYKMTFDILEKDKKNIVTKLCDYWFSNPN